MYTCTYVRVDILYYACLQVLNQDNSETKERIIHRNVTEHQRDIATPLSLLLCSFVVPRLPRESIACNRNRRVTHFCLTFELFFNIEPAEGELFKLWMNGSREAEKRCQKPQQNQNQNQSQSQTKERNGQMAFAEESLNKREHKREKFQKEQQWKGAKELRANGEIN